MLNILDIAFVSLQKCLPKKGCRFNAQPSPEYLSKVQQLYIILTESGEDKARTFLNTSISSLPSLEQRAIREFALASLKYAINLQDNISLQCIGLINHIPNLEDDLSKNITPSINHIPNLDDSLTKNITPSISHIPNIDDNLSKNITPSINHVPNLDDSLTKNITPSINHIPNLDDSLSSDIAPSISHIPNLDDSLTKNITPSINHIPNLDDSLTKNITPSISHIPNIDDSLTKNITPSISHIPNIDDSLSSDITFSLSHVSNIDDSTSTRLASNIQYSRDLLNDIVGNTRATNLNYQKIDKAIIDREFSTSSIDYLKVDKAIIDREFSTSSIDYLKIDKAIIDKEFSTSSIDYLKVGRGILSKYQKSYIDLLTIPSSILSSDLTTDISAIITPTNTITRDAGVSVKYTKTELGKLLTRRKLDIDSIRDTKLETVRTSRSFTIETKEWNYLFDSSQYDWSLDRVQAHSDNIDIKEYCYPSYTVYLTFDPDAPIFTNLLQQDSQGSWYFDYDRRDEIIQGIRKDMSIITYQSQPDIKVEVEYNNLLCISITSVYRTIEQRDEAYAWFNRIYTDNTSILFSRTQYIRHALTHKAATDQCDDQSTYDPPGILYQPVPRDPNAPFQIPNLTIYTDPPSPITIQHHDQDITIIGTRSDIPVTVITPSNVPGTLKIVQDTDTITAGGITLKQNDSIIYNITSTDQIKLIYTGKSGLDQHVFRILFYGIRFRKCNAGTKFVKCRPGTKFVKCRIGTKFVKCT